MWVRDGAGELGRSVPSPTTYTMHRSVNLMVVVQRVNMLGYQEKKTYKGYESVLLINLVIKPGRKRNNKSRS